MCRLQWRHGGRFWCGPLGLGSGGNLLGVTGLLGCRGSVFFGGRRGGVCFLRCLVGGMFLGCCVGLVFSDFDVVGVFPWVGG